MMPLAAAVGQELLPYDVEIHRKVTMHFDLVLNGHFILLHSALRTRVRFLCFLPQSAESCGVVVLCGFEMELFIIFLLAYFLLLLLLHGSTTYHKAGIVLVACMHAWENNACKSWLMCTK